MTQTSCTIQETTHATAELPGLTALRQLFSRHLARTNERRKRRRLLSLLRCDDVILNDIGYTRAELEMALILPYSMDANAELKRWRQWRANTG